LLVLDHEKPAFMRLTAIGSSDAGSTIPEAPTTRGWGFFSSDRSRCRVLLRVHAGGKDFVVGPVGAAQDLLGSLRRVHGPGVVPSSIKALICN